MNNGLKPTSVQRKCRLKACNSLAIASFYMAVKPGN